LPLDKSEFTSWSDWNIHEEDLPPTPFSTLDPWRDERRRRRMLGGVPRDVPMVRCTATTRLD